MESMDAIWQAISPSRPSPNEYNIDFWDTPEHAGWLSKQGEYIKTWRRRWFVLKQGRLLWFRDPSHVIPTALPRGVIQVAHCEVEEIENDGNKLVINIGRFRIYFVADSEREKQEWVSAIGRVVLQNAGAVIPEILDYDQPRHR